MTLGEFYGIIRVVNNYITGRNVMNHIEKVKGVFDMLPISLLFSSITRDNIDALERLLIHTHKVLRAGYNWSDVLKSNSPTRCAELLREIRNQPDSNDETIVNCLKAAEELYELKVQTV